MTNPFLTIVTRSCQRPKMLIKNILSVKSQTDKDIEQIFIVDNQRRGVLWANKQFHANIHRVNGDYVYMLDDDCRLINNSFVAQLRKATKNKPEIIMVHTRRPQLAPKELPRQIHWKKRNLLKLGSTNGLCYVTRSDIWKAHTQRYFINATGDWQFLRGMVTNKKYKMIWLDLFVAETQQLGRGKLFEVNGGSWFSPIVKRFGIKNVGTKDKQDWRLRHLSTVDK